MERNKLDCCVVRDLLPAFLEKLTEPETTAQVRAHLDDCPECRTVEARMRTQVTVEVSSRRQFSFLKREKRARVLAAALTVILTLCGIWWLYDIEFHYANTESGRLAAVTDYVPSAPGSTINHVAESDPLRVIAWQERANRLFIFYEADNTDNVHGIVTLVRGINGKYRPTNASMDPFPYTAGVWAGSVWDKKSGDWLPALAGDSCREIYWAEVEYEVQREGENRLVFRTLTYPVAESDFLLVIDKEELKQKLAMEGETLSEVSHHGVKFLDKEGIDVTAQYRDASVSQSWSGSKSTAEMGFLYVLMGFLALAGAAVVRYFLRRR